VGGRGRTLCDDEPLAAPDRHLDQTRSVSSPASYACPRPRPRCRFGLGSVGAAAGCPRKSLRARTDAGTLAVHACRRASERCGREDVVPNADYFDVEFEDKFDLITCVGVLEWAPKLRPGDDPIEVQPQFLRKLRRGLTRPIGDRDREPIRFEFPPGRTRRPHRAPKCRRRKSGGIPRASCSLLHAHPRRARCASPRYGFFSSLVFWSISRLQATHVILPIRPEVNVLALRCDIKEHDGSNGTLLSFQGDLHSHDRSLANLGIASNFAPSFFVVAE